MFASRASAYSFAVTPSTPAAAFFLICPKPSRRKSSSIRCASVVNCISGFWTACSAILSSFVDTVSDLNVSSVFPCSGRHTRLHFPAIYSGSLGLHHFPTYSAAVFSPQPSVLCSTKTAFAHLGSVRCRGLRTRFPSASHTPSQGSHFGSATRLLATLWLDGILTRWATSTSFGTYRHLPVFHVSLGTRATITVDEEGRGRAGTEPAGTRAAGRVAVNPASLTTRSDDDWIHQIGSMTDRIPTRWTDIVRRRANRASERIVTVSVRRKEELKAMALRGTVFIEVTEQ